MSVVKNSDRYMEMKMEWAKQFFELQKKYKGRILSPESKKEFSKFKKNRDNALRNLGIEQPIYSKQYIDDFIKELNKKINQRTIYI